MRKKGTGSLFAAKSEPVPFFLTLALLLTCPGCVFGLLYSDVTFPLTTNLKGAPLGSKHAEMDVKEIREPFTGASIRVEWDSNAVGDIAKKFGIEKIYGADLRTVSVLFGIWRQEHVIVHGD